MMSPPQICVFISDLHLCLGQGWDLEDFQSDSQMSSLVDFIESRFSGKRVDLIILGDAFDLWQAVPRGDLDADAADKIDLTLNLAQLRQDLETIITRHPGFCDALVKFAGPSAHRLVITAGNHDHALITGELQATLRDCLVRKGFPNRGDNLVFPDYHFYHVPQLGIYAEHGNQYERFNSYHDFLHFGPAPRTDECQGYGLVRLFWNRLENLDHDIDDRPEYWGSWFNWLRRHMKWNTISHAWDWFQEYEQDVRVDPISLNDYAREAALTVPDGKGGDHQTVPEILLDGQNLNPNLFFSQDPMVEAAYRELYQKDQTKQGFGLMVDEILAKKFGLPLPKVPSMPGILPIDLDAHEKLVHPAAGAARSLVLGEPLMRSLGGMFVQGQGPSLYRDDRGHPAHLDPQVYNLVLMGHTHEPRWEAIPHYPGKLYINTGTWTTHTVNGGAKAERTVILAGELNSKEIWVEGGIIDDSGAYQFRNHQRLR